MEFKICLKKLIRTPVKTFLFFLLLAITGSLLSIGTSLLINAKVTNNNIDKSFTTIAVLNFDRIRADYIDPITEISDSEELDRRFMSYRGNYEAWKIKFINEKMEKIQLINKLYYSILEKASETTIGKAEVRKNYLGASKDLTPSINGFDGLDRNFGVFDVDYARHRDIHYDKNYPNYDPELHEGRKSIIFTINDVVSMYPLYQIPEDLEMDSILSERIKRGAVELGKRYFLSGYTRNLLLHGTASTDLSGIKSIQYFRENSFNNSTIFFFDEDFNIIQNRLSGNYFSPYIELKDDPEVFFNTDVGAKYKQLAENCQFYNLALNIVATDNVNAIFDFNQKDALIVNGREITEEEYQKGENVCIVDWSFAQLNNLEVGDEINLSIVDAEYGYYDYLSPGWYLNIDPYFKMEPKEKTFKVVGMVMSSTNKIYVPSKSMGISTDAKDHIKSINEETGLIDQIKPYDYSIIIPNDKLEEFKSEMADKGIEKYFLYYDQGYSSVKSVIQLLTKNAIIILSVCLAVWILVIILFVLLYIVKEKTVAGIMLSLGVGAKRTFMHLLISCMLLSLPATIVGGIASSTLEGAVAKLSYDMAVNQVMDNSFNRMFSANYDISYNVLNNSDDNNQNDILSSREDNIILIVEILQFVVIIFISSIFIYFVLRKNPMELVKGKE